MTNTPSHSPVVVIRVAPADRAVIEAAQSVEGSPTLSGFMRKHALKAAAAIIEAAGPIGDARIERQP
jgi:uncharacterized protein (DUF1778 family)